MRLFLPRNETWLLLACALLAAVALFGPAIAQPPWLHDFADQRTLWGVPHAMDVLSNLPFAAAGVWGLLLVRRLPHGQLFAAQRVGAGVFFAGVLLVTFTSGGYHLAPHDVGLAFDRFGMNVAFAGLLGLAVAGRVSDRAGLALLVAVLVLGPLAVLDCLFTGNVLPWAIVQFGGIAVLLLTLAIGADRIATLPVRWSLVLLAYAIAKLLEMNDAAVFQATGGWLSGHTLKHVAAAFAALPVLVTLATPMRRQNGRPSPAAAA
jgi:hypothetical protein